MTPDRIIAKTASVRRWVDGSSTGGPEREVPPPVAGSP